MKKLTLLTILLSTLTFATEYNWEITPTIGLNLPKDDQVIDDSTIFGGAIQYNGVDSKIKPEIQYLYTEADMISGNAKNDISRIAINGVYNLDKIGHVTPLLKAGIGTEDRSDASDKPFVDLGLGVKIPHNDALALKLEAIYMLTNSKNHDNSLVLLAGLNYAFGAKAATPAPKTQDLPILSPLPVEVPIDGDDDKDGVLNSKDKCPNTLVGNPVNHEGCFIDGDDDKDGVLNSKDKCPNTPIGKLVYNDGCPQSFNLHVTFDNDSSVIHQDSFERINAYAKFLKENTAYSTDIVGYTSNTGSTQYNQKLSEERAIAVQQMIINANVPASKVRAQGKGEANPVASNDTPEGRATNRRIEAEITKD